MVDSINAPVSAEDLYRKNAPLFTKARILMQDSVIDATKYCFPAGLGVGSVSLLGANWHSFFELESMIKTCQEQGAQLSEKVTSLPAIVASSFTNDCVPIDVAFTTAAMGLLAYPMVQAALVALGKSVEKAIERSNPEFKAQKIEVLANAYDAIERQNKLLEEQYSSKPYDPKQSGLSQVMSVINKYENVTIYPEVLKELNGRKNGL